MNSKLSFSIDEKKEKCWFLIESLSTTTTSQDIIKELEKQGVNTGILHDTIEEIVNDKHKMSEKVLIARSIQPTKGKDAEMKHLINVKLDLKTDEHGNVDFYDVGLIKNVHKDDKLVEFTPPTMGKPGKNILGEDIPGTMGKEIIKSKISGTNTEISEDGKYIIVQKDGIYKKNAIGVVSVSDEFTIDSNLDFSVGNIDTNSSINIQGDIKAGFNCKSSSSINVRGVIEDADVVSGENIICKQGILPGDSKVSAKETIRTKYINSRELIECKNLYIEEMISASNVNVLGELEAKRISGGKISVKDKITVDELGSEQYISTIVEIGINHKIMARMDQNRLQLTATKNEIATKIDEKNVYDMDLKKIMRKISDITENSGNKALLEKFNAEEKEKKNRSIILNSEISNLNNKIISLGKEYERLGKKIEGDTPELIVKGKIYPNVTIRIKLGQTYEVKSIMEKVRFVPDEISNVKIEKL